MPRGLTHTLTFLCTCAYMCYMCANVCMWIGAARGTLRASPHGKTSPARLHQSFASSRCFITMALGPPLAIQLPLSLLNWHGWRRCPIESWMKLYERRDGAPVNLASRSENPPNRNPSQKFAEIGIETFLFPFFIMRIFHLGSTSRISFLTHFHAHCGICVKE